MKQVFWVAVGVTATIVVVSKAKKFRQNIVPNLPGSSGIKSDVNGELATIVKEFKKDFLSFKAAKEDQLKNQLLTKDAARFNSSKEAWQAARTQTKAKKAKPEQTEFDHDVLAGIDWEEEELGYSF